MNKWKYVWLGGGGGGMRVVENDNSGIMYPHVIVYTEKPEPKSYLFVCIHIRFLLNYV